jgi:tetrahydromethanopterin S-methyltransferase subunit G
VAYNVAVTLTQEDLSAIGEIVERKLDERLSPFEATVARGFADVYARFDAVDERFASIDSRLDAADSRLGRLEGRFDSLALDVGEVKTRLSRVEQRLDGLAVSVYGRI